MPVTNDLNRHLNGEFEKECCSAMCDVIPTCCFFYVCAPCAIYAQREELLELSGEPYVMCAGTWPCCGFEQPCPSGCLAVESLCCAARAIPSNRFMTQTRLNLRNSDADGCLTCCHVFPGMVVSVARMFTNCSKEQEELIKSGCVSWVCTHCENQVEIGNFKRNRGGLAVPPASLIEALPEHFARVQRMVAKAPDQMPPM